MKWEDMEEYDSTNMKKHILEQGVAVRRTLSKQSSNSDAVAQSISNSERLILSGAGDKYAIPLIAKYIWRRYGDIPLEVVHSRDLASYPPSSLNSETACILLSQSGRTEDTLEAMRLCMERNAYVVGITNLKSREKESFYALDDYDKGNLLTTQTTIYPEQSLPSTQTFHTSMALLDDLLIRTLLHRGIDTGSLLRNLHRKVPRDVDNLSTSKKVIEWAKTLSMNMKEFFGNCFYFMGDGPRYGIARKQALVMFMEGVKQDACAVETEEFIHSLVELLEKDNMSKKPLFVMVPPKTSLNFSLSEMVCDTWSRLAGKEYLYRIDPFEHLSSWSDPISMDLLSPQLYIVPLEWFTYYYALLRGIDPGRCQIIKKVRDKTV
jgi:fructoselysine 6-phosphate deglycase